MNSLINPIWFYIIGVLDNLKEISIVVLIVSGVIFSALLVMSPFVIECWEEISEKKDVLKTPITIFLIIISTSICCLVFIPPKETMYKMLIANTVTYENIDKVEKEIKECVDYIFDKIGDDKDE